MEIIMLKKTSNPLERTNTIVLKNMRNVRGSKISLLTFLLKNLAIRKSPEIMSKTYKGKEMPGILL